MEVRPFTIHVPDDVLDDLRWRLGHTRFPDEIPGSGWDYGSNLEGIVKLLGIIVLPGNRRCFPDVISTDPPFRPPALSPLLQPNSRIAASFLCGTPARIADAVWGESGGQWGHTRTKIAGHALRT